MRGWKKMSDADKIRVNLRVRPLMTAGGKPSSKKVKKMDKKIRKLEKRLAKVRRKREALAAA
ncbi:hypothetical protein C882_0748 [Caenispirillum salinarum AK4]|uniref:Uncharacterized protein n=1 Tax=Caenispirillum salinarum AK4 TaxID=1238182 RepID=K9GW33_9PROT|nr:hypothetical protein C882_0748 [Caenispirillum salinarum AK4]